MARGGLYCHQLFNQNICAMKKSFLRLLITASFVVVGFLGVGCSDENSGTAPLTDIGLDKTTLLLEVGERVTLRPIFTPANAANKRVSWSADSEAVTVAGGVVKGVSVGSAVVTVIAEDGGFTASCNVSVVKDKNVAFVQSVTFPQESYQMTIGQTLALTATVLPENAENKELKWSTKDTNIISVDENNGMVKALALGNATVTASATDGSGVEASVVINVSAVATGVNFSGSENEVYLTTWHGNKLDLDVRTTPANVDLRTLKWSFLTLNSQPNPKGISYEITADKASICCVVDENSTVNTCKIEVVAGDDYAYAKVYFMTYAWIMTSKNNGATFSSATGALCQTSNWRFDYHPDNYLSSQLYFVAYSPKDEDYMAEDSPLSYYPDDIIPTSAYTLTSSDPEKLSLEKFGEKGYRIKVHANEMAAITLTYTCGEYVQNYKINVIQ